MDAAETDRDGLDRDRPDRDRPDGGDVEVVRVERTVVLDVPVSDVWRCLSRLDELASWLALDLDGSHGGDVAAGVAARGREGDGSIRHLLVSEVDEGSRVAWHWWREGGELSAVEITLEPADGDASTVVRVVETVALAAAGAGGRAAIDLATIELVGGIEAQWGSVLPRLGARLASKLGVA